MNTHDAWEQIHQSKEWGQYPSEHVISFIARNFYSAEREKIKILDFGCGGGVLTHGIWQGKILTHMRSIFLRPLLQK